MTAETLAADHELDARPKDECGVFGAWGPPGTRVAELLLDGAYALQHRGQTAVGAAVMGAEVSTIKAPGRVKDVFPTVLESRPANIDSRFPDARAGVSHVRYATSGEDTDTHPYGDKIKAGVNGHFSNIGTLAKRFDLPLSSANDCENAISWLEAETYANGGDLTKAALTVFSETAGGFSVIATDGKCLVGVHDPNSYRPMVMGRKPDGTYILASETIALDKVGATYIQKIGPGQVVTINDDGVRFDQLDTEINETPCLLEDAYFADPRSRLETPEGELETAWDRRVRFGRELAKEHPIPADYVISVPPSADPAAAGYAEESGIPLLDDLLIINPAYKDGRSFIQPTQKLREQATEKKFLLNMEKIELIRGKRLIVVDDSVIRGTTMKRIRRLFEEAGVDIAEFHGLSTLPPTPYDCEMGVDLNHSNSPLLLAKYNLHDAAMELGVDSLGFLSLEGIARAKGAKIGNFCTSCFDGIYETEVSLTPRTLNPSQALVKRY
jgi:amidophosphoribosyltransferase